MYGLSVDTRMLGGRVPDLPYSKVNLFLQQFRMGFKVCFLPQKHFIIGYLPHCFKLTLVALYREIKLSGINEAGSS